MSWDNLLLEQRKWLEEGLSPAYREADKLIVSVSSAVLALSVAFIGQISEPLKTEWMRGAWALFLSAIAAVLLSLIFEQQERLSRIKKIDCALEQGNMDFRDLRGAWGRVSSASNLLGIAAFFGGLFALSLFLSSNLK